MPIGIKPLNYFAFKKTFGTVENKPALISLLNAILDLEPPIVDVTIENPYNHQDFLDDKLSILDIKAIDASQAVYSVEMQLTIHDGLVQRIVFYGCELYADQLRSSDDYTELVPVYSICIANGILWKDAKNVHHAFQLTDKASGRVLDATIQIHTIELPRYNLAEADLTTASTLDRWLYWLLHAHEYEPATLPKLFPETAMQLATQTITRIAEMTEDKTMYDAREKAIRDHQWALNAAHREGKLEGKIEGEIKVIRTLEVILGLPLSTETELAKQNLEELQKLTALLQEKARNRV